MTPTAIWARSQLPVGTFGKVLVSPGDHDRPQRRS